MFAVKQHATLRQQRPCTAGVHCVSGSHHFLLYANMLRRVVARERHALSRSPGVQQAVPSQFGCVHSDVRTTKLSNNIFLRRLRH